MNSVCVYCGSSPGVDTVYLGAARTFGGELARRDLRLVFGGVGLGLMGAVADGALDAGGAVTGIIPEPLYALGIAHPRVTDIRLTASMHERKHEMAEQADGFAVLPGGCGTMDEFFEVFTWAQLGLHSKPIGILNTHGYYAELQAFIGAMVTKRFLKPAFRESLVIESEPTALLDRMRAFQPLRIPKWHHRTTP
jgi:hypothetical protein